MSTSTLESPSLSSASVSSESFTSISTVRDRISTILAWAPETTLYSFLILSQGLRSEQHQLRTNQDQNSHHQLSQVLKSSSSHQNHRQKQIHNHTKRQTSTIHSPSPPQSNHIPGLSKKAQKADISHHNLDPSFRESHPTASKFFVWVIYGVGLIFALNFLIM